MVNQHFANIDLQKSARGFRVILNENTTHEAIVSLLEWLHPGYELSFYDQLHPSVSDPGAYLSIQRKEDRFAYFMGNHGWSSGWKVQSKQMLAALIHINIGTKDPFQDIVYQITIRQARHSPKW